MFGKAISGCLMAAIAFSLASCSRPSGPAGTATAAENQPYPIRPSDPPQGHWDVEPKSIKAADLTPMSPCMLIWTAADGASFGQVFTGIGVFFAVSKQGQGFPELTPYKAALSGPAGQLTFAMQPHAGRSLGVLVSFQNDPKGAMLNILNSGFRLTVTGQSAGLVLDEIAPPVGFMNQLANGTCLGMMHAAAQRHWVNPPTVHKP